MNRAAALGLAALLLAGRAAAAAPTGVAVEEHVGARIPLGLELTDARGAEVALGRYFDGKPVLLVLAYSRCAMLCNLVLRGVARAAIGTRARAGRDYRIVAVSIDPEETPADAARHEQALEPRGAWSFLVGRDAAIRSLAASLGFVYAYDPRTRQYAHPSVIFAIAPDGRIRRYLYGVDYPPGEVDAALAGEPAEAEGAVVLECFRAEDARGYRSIVVRALQIGAVAIVAALAGLVALLQRRARA